MRLNGLSTTVALLLTIYVSCIVIAQVTASKLVRFGMFVLPAGFLAYSITFLITDILHEWLSHVINPNEAYRTCRIFVIAGLVANLLLVVLVYAAIVMPPLNPKYQVIYEKVLGFSFRIVLASLVAYIVSQFIDITIFHKLRQVTHGKHAWLRNNTSTITAQFIDTCIFITIAFGFNIHIILSQWIWKTIVALCDTLPFYIVSNYLTGKFRTIYNKLYSD